MVVDEAASADLELIVHGLGGCLEGGCCILGGDSGGQLFACRRFADRFGHLADGSDDAAGADAYSWEGLHLVPRSLPIARPAKVVPAPCRGRRNYSVQQRKRA